MRFQLSHLDPETDSLDDFVACQIAAFNTPFQSLYRFWYPIFGDESETAKKAALKDLADLHRTWAREDPDCVFLQIRDREKDGKVAAGLLFKVHKRDPFKGRNGYEESVLHYPKGRQREYITKCLEVYSEPRRRFIQRPHVYITIAFTHPSYRKLGLLNTLFTECFKTADKLGLECYLESINDYAVPIYQRHDFIPYHKHSIQPHTSEQNAEWRDIESKMQPLSFWPMWRPPYGRIEGETSPPWKDV